MKKERKGMNLKSTNGITLIALVITIVVLIILAGVAINLSLSNNGIFNRAKQAREDYKHATNEEQSGLANVEKAMDEIAGGGTTNSPAEIKEIAGVKGGDYFEKPTTVKDSNGNLIKVPQGFKIAQDSGINVTEGIVIEDNDIITGIGNNRGNQYVWIPVGTGIKKSDGTTVDITLGRYTFADGTNDKASDGTTVLAKGTPILQQSAENYTQEVVIGSYYKELSTSRIGVASMYTDGLNTTALNLKGFVDSVKANGGYYIARYEASYGTDGKANSKVSNTFIDEQAAPTTEGTLWNNITQIDAATASRNLYTTATTDLINSYAWDTAIVYIQNFSGDADYSYQDGKSINSSLTNTGANGDEVCKINDMASNIMEWTTEYSPYTNSRYAAPCTFRGGHYYNSNSYTSDRKYNVVTEIRSRYTFRSTLYI